MDKKFRALTFCCQEAQTDCDWISAINANKRNVMTRIRPPKGIFVEKKKKKKPVFEVFIHRSQKKKKTVFEVFIHRSQGCN